MARVAVGSCAVGSAVGPSVGTGTVAVLLAVADGAAVASTVEVASGVFPRTRDTNSCRISSVRGIDQTAMPSISLVTVSKVKKE